LVRAREGDLGRGSTHHRENPSHPNALPDKPTWLSEEAGEFWDDYCRTTAPGLLRLVHAPALGQLCEDNALAMRFRRSIKLMEDAELRNMERQVLQATEKGQTVDTRDLLPGGPLPAIASSEEGSRIFRCLNQIVVRVQRQEQQFGLTPSAASRVDLGTSGKVNDDFEDELCG
jgi:hypothetical protein